MPKRPNIIVLILDALRARNVSCYGYERRTTPYLDRFAAKNALFRRAFSPATWTVPSHASMLTGLYVSQHRIESLEADRRFNEEIVTLPEALGTAGYRTAAFSQNMLFGPQNHLERGFDEFHAIDDLLKSRWTSRQIVKLSDRSTRPWGLAARYLRKMIAPRRLLDSAADWIGRAGSQPFFLMANVLAPHFPWTVPPGIMLRERLLHPRYLLKRDYLTLKEQWKFNSGRRAVTDAHRRCWRRLYDASVVHADREIGRFLERLRGTSRWQDTVVVVTSDHGEMLGDYRDIVGHMLTLHDNLIRVPLVVRHPDFAGGRTVEGVVQTLDLYSSILEWAGAAGPNIPEAQLERPSLSRAMERSQDAGGYAFAEEDYSDSYDVLGKLRQSNPAMEPDRFPQRQIAVRSATHKYIWCDDRPAELYDLTADPNEESNLINGNAPQRSAVLAELESQLVRWRGGLQVFPPEAPESPAEMDEVVMQRLRSLGYVL